MASTPVTEGIVEISDAQDLRLVHSAALSADGQTIGYCVRERDPATRRALSNVWVSSARRSRSWAVTDQFGDAAEVRWSPDGSKLAFTAGRGGWERHLFLATPADGELHQLTDTGLYVADPQWLPDGSEISIIVSDRAPASNGGPPAPSAPTKHGKGIKASTAQTRLATVRLTQTKAGNLPEPFYPSRWRERLHIWSHVWSPDGRRCAAVISRGEGWDEIYGGYARVTIFDRDGQQELTIDPDCRSYWASQYLPNSLSWAPSGNGLAFLAGFLPGVYGGSAIFIWRSEGGLELRFADEEGTPMGLHWRREDRLAMLRLTGVRSTIWDVPTAGSEPEIALGGDVVASGTLTYEIAEFPPAPLRLAFDRDGGSCAVRWSDASHPPELWIAPIGEEAAQLTQLNSHLCSRRLGKTESWTWQAADGLSLEGLLVLPVGRETLSESAPTPPPAIIALHGGPAEAWDDRFYANWLMWAQLFAGRGYLTFMPNPRGSEGRGNGFQIANRNDWMGSDRQDILRGVDSLVDNRIVDPNRLGLIGYSYGGFATASIITRTSRFRAAIVGAGIIDLLSWYGTTDLSAWYASYNPEAVGAFPDGLDAQSPIREAAKVITPTLIVHGQSDERVPVGQAWELFNTLQSRGIDSRLVVFPGEGHLIQDDAHQREFLEECLMWFDTYV